MKWTLVFIPIVIIAFTIISTETTFAQHPTFYPAADSLAIWGTCIPPTIICHLQTDNWGNYRFVFHSTEFNFVRGIPPDRVTATFDSVYFEIRDSLGQNRYEIWFTHHSPYYPEHCLVQFDSTRNVMQGSFDLTLFVIQNNTVIDSLVVPMTSYHTGLGVDDGAGIFPVSPELYQNYPNPFNPVTTIDYTIPKSGLVTLNVYNITGKLLATIINGHSTAGKHTVLYDGSMLPSGTYFYQFRFGGIYQTKKMILIK